MRHEFRKPEAGMWKFLFDVIKRFQKKINRTLTIEKIFFVGDAAGRTGDFSDSDKQFVINGRQYFQNLEFIVPEDFFPPFDTEKIPNSENNKIGIIMVGMPGSGKSTFIKNVLEPKGYISVASDDYSSESIFLRAINENLSLSLPIVIDSTAGTYNKRRKYYNLLKKYDYYIIVIHLNRNGFDFNKLRPKKKDLSLDDIEIIKSRGGRFQVPTIAFNTYHKYFVDPSLDEEKDLFFDVAHY